MNKQAYINGAFIKGNAFLKIKSPINLKTCGEVPALNTKEIDSAFEAAERAFVNWRMKEPQKRIELLENFAKILDSNKGSLSDIMVHEIGKKKSESIVEIERSIQMIYDTIKEYQKLLVTTKNSLQLRTINKSAKIWREAFGVVLAISPYNYPVNLALAKVIPALLTGNTVVLKPATNGSLVACELAVYFHNAKFPRGTINVVTGRGKEIGNFLTKHKTPKVITYTGSTQVGKNISKNSYMQNIILEMGGNSPAIVLADTDIARTAKKIVKSAFSFSGQRCTSLKRILVDELIADELIIEISQLISTLKTGSALEEENDVVHLITEEAAKYNKKLIKDAIDKGAEVSIGGAVEGNLVYPTLITNTKNNMKIVQEEQFGPIIPLTTFKNIDEAIEMANNTAYGLQTSIFTKDVSIAEEIAQKIVTGTVNFNGAPSRGPDILPFTGVKDSGFGVQGIRESILSMTRPKNYIYNKAIIFK